MCKKKIAELLSKALEEANEFAALYAPIVRRKLVRANSSHAPDPAKKREVEEFGENSEEFKDGIRKVSPQLIALIKDQFKCEPNALLRGAFQDETPPKLAEIQQDTIETVSAPAYFDTSIPEEESDD